MVVGPMAQRKSDTAMCRFLVRLNSIIRDDSMSSPDNYHTALSRLNPHEYSIGLSRCNFLWKFNRFSRFLEKIEFMETRRYKYSFDTLIFINKMYCVVIMILLYKTVNILCMA